MNKISQKQTDRSTVTKYAIVIAVGWTTLMAGMAVLESRNAMEHQRSLIRNEARAHFHKDQAFRAWGAKQGGVYVSPTEHTPPNPYLAHLPLRDVVTTTGMQLTLMNPAYMVRQMMDDYAELYGVRGRITSAKPLRPENAPDEWERLALEAFERGETEVSEFTTIKGEPYLRLMRPMVTGKPCLKCHGSQGYREGDIRGGVGVSVAAEPYFAQARSEIFEHTSALGLIWLIGVTFLALALRKIRRRVFERDSAVAALLISEDRHRTILETAMDGFCLIDLDGRLLEVNDAYSRMSGYSVQELKTMCVSDLEACESASDVAVHFQRVSMLGLDRFETRHRRKDCSVFDVEVQVQYLPIEGGRIVAFLRDITERRNAENALQEERRLFVGGPTVVFKWRATSGWPVEYVSHNVFNQFGHRAEALMSADPPFADLVHPDDLARVAQEVERYTLEKIPMFEQEYRLRRADGEYRWLYDFTIVIRNPEGVVTHYLGYVQDITDRRRDVEALRESREVLHAVLNSIPVRVFWKDRSLKFLGCNAQFARDAGFERPEELIGKDDHVMGWKEQAELYQADDRSVIETGLTKLLFEEPQTTPSGEQIHLLTSKVPLRDAGGTVVGVLGTYLDITERKRAEDALRESEEQHRTILRTAMDGFWVTDVRGNLLEVNDTYCHMSGYTEQELLTKHVTDIDLTSPTEVAARIQGIFAHGADRFESRHRRKDGSLFDVEISIQSLPDRGGLLVGFLRDITVRKRAEEELRLSESRYHQLFNSVMEGIGVVDQFEVIQYCNPAFVDLFEAASREELVGRCLLDFVSVEQRPKVLSQTDLRKQGLSTQYEIDITTARGRKRSLLASISPRFDDQKNYRGAFGAVIDITENRRLQDLESRAQRLEAAGKIAGQVAHDFNNMLAPIMAYPELIRERLPVGDPGIEFLDAIEDSAQKIADLNQQLLTLSRRGHYNLEILNLNELVHDVLRDMIPIPDTLVIETTLADDLMNVKGGTAQLHRVVMNLLVNARDAMQDIGRMSIRTENYYVDDTTICYGRVPRGEYAKITISDTGCGIPEDVVQKIFDPFFTTKSTDRRRGSGLGLSVVDAVLKDHDGHIDLSTTVGVGTSFYLYLPITRAALSEAASDEVLLGDETILIVDDDEIQRDVSARLLTTLGYEVTVCESGTRAIELLREEAYDLLLLDMIMPGDLDGTETYRQSLLIRSDQKAIIVSGFSESDRVDDAQRLGAGAFVKKPLSRRAIAAAVRRELDRALIPEQAT